jgi:hypothetical protein
VAAALLSVTLNRLLSPPSDPSSLLMAGGAVTPPAEVAARLNRLFPDQPTLTPPVKAGS